jgi:phage gpG-like protein
MADDSMVVIVGYSDLMAELKAMPPRYRRAVTGVFRDQARAIVRQAGVFAPAGQATGRTTSGRLATDVSIRVGQNYAAITWNAPYAGVQEFATDYLRRNPTHRPKVVAPRGMKKTYRQTGTVGSGYHEVHFRWAPPPRFIYRAWRTMRPRIETQVQERLIAASTESKWFEATAA